MHFDYVDLLLEDCVQLYLKLIETATIEFLLESVLNFSLQAIKRGSKVIQLYQDLLLLVESDRSQDPSTLLNIGLTILELRLQRLPQPNNLVTVVIIQRFHLLEFLMHELLERSLLVPHFVL